MRDRTIILLALLFLVLTIGTGVNRSLTAGNKMLGRQMAPSIDQIYRQQAPLVLEGAKEIAAHGKVRSRAVIQQYPVLVSEFKAIKVRITERIVSAVTYWRGKWSSHLNQKMIY